MCTIHHIKKSCDGLRQGDFHVRKDGQERHQFVKTIGYKEMAKSCPDVSAVQWYASTAKCVDTCEDPKVPCAGIYLMDKLCDDDDPLCPPNGESVDSFCAISDGSEQPSSDQDCSGKFYFSQNSNVTASFDCGCEVQGIMYCSSASAPNQCQACPDKCESIPPGTVAHSSCIRWCEGPSFTELPSF